MWRGKPNSGRNKCKQPTPREAVLCGGATRDGRCRSAKHTLKGCRWRSTGTVKLDGPPLGCVECHSEGAGRPKNLLLLLISLAVIVPPAHSRRLFAFAQSDSMGSPVSDMTPTCKDHNPRIKELFLCLTSPDIVSHVPHWRVLLPAGYPGLLPPCL